MIVKVEYCVGANRDSFFFRCTLPDGDRVKIDDYCGGNGWKRRHATELRDYIENHYSVNRNSIKLEHC